MRIPSRRSISDKRYGNRIVQLLYPSQDCSIGPKRFSVTGKFIGRVAKDSEEKDFLLVSKSRLNDPDYKSVLLVTDGDQEGDAWPTATQLDSARWLRPMPINLADEDIEISDRRCRKILDSWTKTVSIHDEVRANNAVLEPGLRPPQTGAIYATFAHWRVTHEPATIVMPTSTGKTETMLALFVHERLPRLLVIVPTRPLREQQPESLKNWGYTRNWRSYRLA